MADVTDPSERTATALCAVRDAVAGASLALAVPGADEARAERDALVQQVNDYLLPRLASLDAPVLAVVGGSTGAGKSTLVNSLVGQAVTTAGVLRPTTRAPVLVCAPADRHWFAGNRVLPGLARTTGTPGGATTLHLVTAEQLPDGLALLDAPDIDSVVAANRELAGQLLAAADLWIFVTTAARYADAVPWELLRGAQQRSAALALVLDRVPDEAVAEVREDLLAMLVREGLGAAQVFSVAETQLRDGLLPGSEVDPVRRWLHDLAADADARARVVRQTLKGALAAVDRRVRLLAEADSSQAAAAESLRESAADAYALAAQDVEEGVRGGTLLRGEVLARWQEFVGTGELLHTVQARVSRLRDRLVAAVSGRSSAPEEVRGAVETEVESLVRAAADGAAERTVERWRDDPAGRALLDGAERRLGRCSPAFDARLPEQVRAWQAAVLDLVREQGKDKRTSARLASYGVNGAGLAVMLAVFAHTGGVTGTEVVVAGGTSAASQKVLEAIFGDQAVRALARDARVDLLERVATLLAQEEDRFVTLVNAARAADGPGLSAVAHQWAAVGRQL